MYSETKLNENSPKYPKYRSSWELKFLKFLDLNSSVESWTSEPFGIPYFHPFKQKICRYYPDFLFEKSGQKFLIEIKPSKETVNPKTTYDKIANTINLAKWKSAREFCELKGIKFCILTEKELKI